MTPLAWFLISRIYKPALVSREQIDQFIDAVSEQVPSKMGVQEIKVLIIIGVMLVLWVSSSWFPIFNVMIVATLGCCVMFLPGIDVLDVDTFLRENSWDAFFLVGTVLSISNAMIRNGVSDCIAGIIPSLKLPAPALIAFTAAMIFSFLVIIPVATSLVPILSSALIAMAQGAGVSPALIMMTAAICACNCYLLPLDTVPLITYSKGYYSMTDMAKSTFFMQLAIILLSALWLPVVGKIFGFL